MFIGRDAEQTMLRELLVRARRGAGSVLVLEGDPGIGKSSLLAAAYEYTEDSLVLLAAGNHAESALEYAGLHALLYPVQHRIDTFPDEEALPVRRALRLTPGETPSVYAVAISLLAVLSRLADPALVLLLDDVQWLDEQSTAVFSFVARRLRNDTIAMIMAVRRGSSAAALLADLPRLALAELDRACVQDLLATRFQALTAVERGVIAREVSGNPLALIEAAEALLRGVAPSRIALLAYEARLDAGGRALRAAVLLATLESRPSRRLVTTALRRLGHGERALTRAVGAGLLRLADDAVCLVHPLVGDAALRSSPAEQLRAVHRVLADPELPGHDRARAVVHEAAAAEQPDYELAAAFDAMADAAAVRADSAAVARAARRAAELSADAAGRIRRELRAGSAGVSAGLAWAPGVLERVRREAPDTATRSAAELVLVTRATWSGELAEVLSIASRSSSDDDAAAHVHAAATSASFVAWDANRMHEHARRTRALVEAGRGKDRALPEIVLLMVDAFGPGPLPSSAMRRSTASFLRAPDIDLATPLVVTLLCHDEWVLAEMVLERCLPMARAQAAMPAVAWLQCWAAHIHLHRGELAAAEVAAEESLDLAGAIGLDLPQGQAQAALVRVDSARGRVAQARHRVRVQRQIARERGFIATDVWLAFEELRLDLGSVDPAGVTARLVALAERMRPVVGPVFAPLPIHVLLVQAYVRSGQAGSAAACVQELQELVTRRPHRSGLAWLAYCRLLTAAPEQRMSAYDQARIEVEAAGDVLLVVECDLALGRQVRPTDNPAGVAALGAARARYLALGAPGFAGQVSPELMVPGAPTTGQAADLRLRLTPQERQIAELAATGARTVEIATTLFLSPKTVEYHLTHVYRKLGVRSKAQLAHRFGT